VEGEKLNISVIGCGRWGSFIAWYLNKLKHHVLLYGRESSTKFQELKDKHTNGLVTIDENIQLCSELKKTVAHADTIVISISSQNLRALMQELAAFSLSGKTIVLCMKGIEEQTGKRLTEIVSEYVDASVEVAIWVGPGHVQDFTGNIPNCMVIDSGSSAAKIRLVDAFSSDLIRFYYGNDLVGNEIGAASKNVIGIAAGMLDGLNRTSLKGALMSRGTREIARLIKAMGGSEITAYGLSHLGDYEATVFSQFSHNRKFGELFVKGKKYTELAEGVSTTKALMKLSEIYQVELPICQAVHAVLYQGEDPWRVLSGLFLRSLKQEF
jgi:glycerol-3-phosphate dehydrogenase (NAD(P)+)